MKAVVDGYLKYTPPMVVTANGSGDGDGAGGGDGYVVGAVSGTATDGDAGVVVNRKPEAVGEEKGREKMAVGGDGDNEREKGNGNGNAVGVGDGAGKAQAEGSDPKERVESGEIEQGSESESRSPMKSAVDAEVTPVTGAENGDPADNSARATNGSATAPATQSMPKPPGDQDHSSSE